MAGETTDATAAEFSSKHRVCPFRPMDCGPHCALFNGGYNACCIKLLAASMMKMAEYRKDVSS